MNSFRQMKLKLSKPDHEESVKEQNKEKNISDINRTKEDQIFQPYVTNKNNALDYDVNTPPPSPPSESPAKRMCLNKPRVRQNTLQPQCLFEQEICKFLPNSTADSTIEKSSNVKLEYNQRPFISPITTDEETELPKPLDKTTVIPKDYVTVINPTSEVTSLPAEEEKKLEIFRCKFCERTFSYLCHLKVHERVHTGEKPYSCKFCATPFSQLGSLTVHMRIHTGEKPYQCKVCAKKFRHINSLRRHQRQVHAGQAFSPIKDMSYVVSQSSNVNVGKQPTKDRVVSPVSPFKVTPIPFYSNPAIPSKNIGLTNRLEKSRPSTSEAKQSIFTSIDKLISNDDNCKKTLPKIAQNLNYFSPAYRNFFALRQRFLNYNVFLPKIPPLLPNKLPNVPLMNSPDEGYSGTNSDDDKAQNNKPKPKLIPNPKLTYFPHKHALISNCKTSRKWSEDSGIY